MKLQTIKNKLYKQLDMKPDMCGRIFINESLNMAYAEGRESLFLEGLQKGLDLACEVAKKQGYEMSFPKVEKVTKEIKTQSIKSANLETKNEN